ncbi:unnamed protein product [Arctogadus glacialis]
MNLRSPEASSSQGEPPPTPAVLLPAAAGLPVQLLVPNPRVPGRAAPPREDALAPLVSLVSLALARAFTAPSGTSGGPAPSIETHLSVTGPEARFQTTLTCYWPSPGLFQNIESPLLGRGLAFLCRRAARVFSGLQDIPSLAEG